MKRLAYPLLFLTVFLVSGCGGGHTLQPTSEALSDGMKELRKGTGWYQKGCYQKSLGNFLKACELFAASDELAGTAMCMNNLGNVYRFIGDPESALLFFDESYAIYTDLNQDQGAIQSLDNKSAVLIQENRLEDADAVIQKAEALAAMGQSEEAGSLLQAAVREAQVLGARFLLWRLHASLGRLYRALGRHSEAEEEFASAHNLVEKLANTAPEGELRDNFLQRAHAMVYEAKIS